MILLLLPAPLEQRESERVKVEKWRRRGGAEGKRKIERRSKKDSPSLYIYTHTQQ